LTAKSKSQITAIVASALLLASCSNAVVATGEYAQTVDGITPTCETFKSGEAVKLVEAPGEFNTQPEVTFPFPLEGTGMETNVIIEGNGGPIVGSQRVGMHFAGYNASTGEQFQASEFGGEQYIYQDLIPGNSPDFCAALTGVQLGSRVAVLLSPENVHGGEGIPSLGLGPNDGVVFVFDLVKAFLPKANGSAKSAEAGMPTVILAPSGQPGIQIPNSDAPTEFKRTILIEGKGELVAIGDNVTVHYTGWTWQGEEFDSSWPRQAPAAFDVTTDGLIEGFVQALDGVTVGSQVIAVIPPELGYGDSAQGSIPPGSTLIFVIDVLGKE
jgi:FKBP-type peptidyl-prolyl cis-trans isomerase